MCVRLQSTGEKRRIMFNDSYSTSILCVLLNKKTNVANKLFSLFVFVSTRYTHIVWSDQKNERERGRVHNPFKNLLLTTTTVKIAGYTQKSIVKMEKDQAREATKNIIKNNIDNKPVKLND